MSQTHSADVPRKKRRAELAAKRLAAAIRRMDKNPTKANRESVGRALHALLKAEKK
jgi:hypothetical protein